MNLENFLNTPFRLCISFHKLIEHYEQVAAGQPGLKAEHAKQLLKEIEPYPELKDGITDFTQIERNAEVVSHLLADLFPDALAENEIKAVTVPFNDLIFNPSERFKKILNNAGPNFDISIRDFNEHQLYVFSCCIILNDFYNVRFDFSKPLFYDIPTASGIVKHYRILYNADFMEIVPTERSVKLTPEDIDLLRDNFDDLALWKKLFPQGSWTLKGFAIINLFDATVENAVSTLKGTLLGASYTNNVKENIRSVFRSIFRIPDLEIGFTSFNADENKFSPASFNPQLKSYLLVNQAEEDCLKMLCVHSLAGLVEQQTYVAVSDVKKQLLIEPDNILAQRFNAQDINSFILAPVIKNGHLLGIIELAAHRALELNSINANQLEIVMPFITDTIDKQYTNMQNQVRALIQNEYTTIHPSVYWKFRREALKAIQYLNVNKDYALKEVTFHDVYPLYGQVDIKGSSDTRNRSVQLDLEDQLAMLIPLVEKLQPYFTDTLPVERVKELRSMLDNLHLSLRADTEQYIQNYLETYIHPVLVQVLELKLADTPRITAYLKEVKANGEFHQHRKKYETTVALINEKLSLMLDRWQVKAQTFFPHYYERFKTDGVEHNLYIGASIAPTQTFEIAYLYNLRLWQIQILCEMENEHHFSKKSLPYQLEVTSLILAFSLPISIRFRMDEKRFDVDGTYNARFEIVKKRIDKACVRGTTERITAIGKITIVYTNQDEEREYKSYIRFLQLKKILGGDIEMLEVEDLQGVSGLKALRVKIAYDNKLSVRKYYGYSEMLEETKTGVY